MHKSDDSLSALKPLLQDQLRALNRDFLALLTSEHGKAHTERRPPTLFLPPAVARELGELTPTALDGVAQCRYTLFALSFHATELWRRLGHSSKESESVEQRYRLQGGAVASSNQETNAAFLAVALTFAWHLHHMDRRLARVILALRDDTARVFESIPLWRLQQIAHERPDLLTARWPDNPGFWPDLIRIARDGSSAQLESARLVGAQLIAQELEPSSIQRLSPPSTPPRRK